MRGRFLNRALVLLLISSMAAGTIPQAYAVEGYNDVTADVDEITGDLIVGSGGVGITDVTLLVEGEDEPEPEVVPFSAYVPVELPIKMNTQGDVFTPDNAMIINGVETKGIKVESITASLDDGWAPADWDDDFSAKEKDTQEISLKLRDDTLDSSGNFNITEGDWNIPKNSYIDLNMGAKLPKQSANSNKKRVAQLEFALNWSGDDETVGPEIPIDIGKPETPDPDPTPVESDIKAIYDESILLPGSTNTIKFDWTADAEDVTLASIESDDTSIIEIVQEQTRIANLSEGSKVVTIRAVAKGTANVTATLSTGKEAVVSIDVCELDESGEITFDIDESKLVAGGSLTADDITANIPILKPDGSTTTIQRHPSSLDNNTLIEGSNTISGSVSINGSEVPVEVVVDAKRVTANFRVSLDSSAPEHVYAGDTVQAIFEWDDIEGTDLTLDDVVSSVPALVSVGNIQREANKAIVTLNAEIRGSVKITGTLSNGEKVVLDIGVYGIDTTKDITYDIPEDKLTPGTVLTPDDITVTIPIRLPFGTGGFDNLVTHPVEVPSTPLVEGNNSFVVKVPLGGHTIDVTIDVVAKPVSCNLTARIVDQDEHPELWEGENIFVEFTWDETPGVTFDTASTVQTGWLSVYRNDIQRFSNRALVPVRGNTHGTPVLTGRLSNGEEFSIQLDVYGTDFWEHDRHIEVKVASGKDKEGTVLKPEDITLRVPCLKPDKTTEITREVHPLTVPSTPLKLGENTLEVEYALGTRDTYGSPYKKTITITAVKNVPATSPASWFTYDGATITGLSDEYLNMVDAPANLVLPKSAGGAKLTAIGKEAFKGRDAIESIYVPSTITSIGVDAFYNCSSITDLTIEGTLSGIGSRAFHNMDSLEHLTLKLGDSCTNVSPIVYKLNNNMTQHDYITPFHNMNPNFVLEIAEGSTRIPAYFLYKSCYEGSPLRNVKYDFGGKKVILPDSIKVIGASAFQDLDYIQSGPSILDAKLPTGLETIGEKAFAHSGLKYTGFEDTQLQSIGIWAFTGNNLITDITLPSTMQTVSRGAFDSSNTLTTVKIPKSATFTKAGDYGLDGSYPSFGTIVSQKDITINGVPYLQLRVKKKV